MSEEDYNVVQRIKYIVGKSIGEGLLSIPKVGLPVTEALDKTCKKVDLMHDYITQTRDDTRGAGCDGIRNALAENLGGLTPGSEGSQTGSTKHCR